MGNNINKLDSKIKVQVLDIKQEISDLIKTSEFWLNDDVCDKLEVVYLDKLTRYKKEDLTELSLAIGVKPANNVDKTEICQDIIFHYKSRIDLLRKIDHMINKTMKQNKYITDGPVCRGVDKFVDNLDACAASNGIWIGEQEYKEYLSGLKKHKRYDLWIERVNKLYGKYYFYIDQLSKIVGLIKKDILEGNVLSTEKFEIHKLRANEIMKRTEILCDRMYLILINAS